MLTAYEAQKCKMSPKLHFLYLHLEYFTQSFGAYRGKQGERFHQNLRTMGKRYQGIVDVNMIGDYC